MSDEIELEIAAGEEPGTFQVRVMKSAAAGQPRARLMLDPNAILGRRAELEQAVLASAVPSHRPGTSAAEQQVRQVGRELFEALFTGPSLLRLP